MGKVLGQFYVYLAIDFLISILSLFVFSDQAQAAKRNAIFYQEASTVAKNSGLAGTSVIGFGGLPNLVLVGASGTISYSTDSSVYTLGTSGFGATNINAIAHGNGTWVIAGDSGKLSSSTDGLTWSSRTSNFGASAINSVAYGGGLWVAGGVSGTLATSSDAITWTTRTSGFGATTINSVSYANSLYVAAGNSGTLTTSPDGITWTSRTSNFGGNNIKGVHYGGGLWVAVGDGGTLCTSPDGITWTSRTSSFGATNINGVWYGQDSSGTGVWVAVGDAGKMAASYNGTFWSQQASPFGATNIARVTWDASIAVWALVGASGKVATATGTAELVSDAKFGTTNVADVAMLATAASSTTSAWLVGGGTYNRVGDSTGTGKWVIGTGGLRYATSSDAITWGTEARLSWSASGTSSVNTWSLANDGTNWMAINWVTGDQHYVTNVPYTSADGITWTEVEASGLQYSTAPFISSLSYANGKWFGSDNNGYIYYSSDGGATWARSTLPCSSCTISSVKRVAYNGTTYVTVGGTGSASRSWSSADGVTWTERSNNLTGTGYTMVVGGDSKFVRASEVAPQYSSDGITWSTGSGTNCTGGMHYVWHNGQSGGSSLWVLAGANRVCTSTDGATWTDQGNDLTGGSASSIGFTGGTNTFVIGCTSGYIYRSTDGVTWSSGTNNFGTNTVTNIAGDGSGDVVAMGNFGRVAEHSTNSGSSFASVTYGPVNSAIDGLIYANSKFVAFSKEKIFDSTDASSWSSQTSPNAYYMNHPSYGNSTWVFGNAYGYQNYSTDLSSWSSADPTGGGSALISTSNAFGNSLFVASGYTGAGTYYIYSSPDGASWTSRLSTSFAINDIVYGNSKFVAVGASTRTYTSTDGITWSANVVAFSGTMNTVTYGNGLYIAGGADGALYSSTDGVSWTARTSNFGTDDIRDSGYSNGTYVIVGGDLNSSKYSTSTDGITWTARTSPFVIPIYSVTPGTASAQSDGTIKNSSDASSWGAVTPTNAGFSSATVYDMAYGNGVFLAVGAAGTVSKSTYGTNWATVTDSDYTSATDFYGVTYGNNKYVIGGSGGKLLFSATGASSSWSLAATTNFTTDTVYDLAYGNSNYVAVGGTSSVGRIVYSADADTWTSAVTGATCRFNSVAYNGSNLFVAAGAGGSSPYNFYTSADGATWTSRTSANLPSTVYGVAHDQSAKWLAVGASGTVASSADGITWAAVTDADFGTTELMSVSYGAGTWTITGVGGKVFTSTTGNTNSWTVSADADVTGITSINASLYATYTSGVAASSIVANPTLPPSTTCTINLFNPSTNTQNFTLTMSIPSASGTGSHYTCSGNVASVSPCSAYLRPESSPPTNFITSPVYASVAPDLDGDADTGETNETYSSTLTAGETKVIQIRYPQFPANVTGEMKYVCQGTLSVEDSDTSTPGFIQAYGEINVFTDESFAQQSGGSRIIMGQYKQSVVKFNIGPGGKKEL